MTPDDGNPGALVAQLEPDTARSFADYRAQATVDQTMERIRAYRAQQASAPPPSPIAQEVQRVGRGLQTGAAAAADTASTVVRNLADVPLQIPAGVIEGVRETFRAADDIAGVLQRVMPLPGPDAADPPRPGHAIADAIPQPFPDARTPAGRLTRQASAIVYGYLRGMRATAPIAGALGTAGRIAQPLVAGAIADAMFTDPGQERLSNMWQQLGLPQNSLTDYLAAQPGDTAADGRLKNAIEGVVQGAALDLVLATARGARAALRSRVEVVGETDADRILAQAREQYGTMDPARVGNLLGDPAPDAPRLALTGRIREGVDNAESRLVQRMRQAEADTADVAGGGTAAQLGDAAASARPGERSMFVNFARIAEPEDVQSVLRDMVEAFSPSIDAARRGRVSNDETRALANDLGLTVDDVVGRRRGPMSAEEALAARELLNQSAERLLATARVAADANATPADLFAFRRMMSVHYAVQAEVIAARTETARALQSWSMPAGGGGVEAARAVQQALDAAGGGVTQQAMARRLVALAANGATPATLASVVRGGAMARTFDAFQEVWINGLLSSVPTHMVNVTGNAATAFNQVWERMLAERVGSIVGQPGSVAPGEGLAMLYGMVTGLTDAVRLAGRTWRDGNGGEVAQMLGRVDLPREAAVSAEAFGLSQASGLGRAIDFFGHSIVRQPSRLLGGEDAFFKSIAFRMELHAASLREASQRLGPDGRPLRGPALWEEMGRIMRDPPEHVRLQAADAALYATFNDQGGRVVQALMGLRRNIPIAVFALPFIRTPANVLRYSFERTPLAPLVAQWRADIVAGGARRDLALARLASGSAALAIGFDLADRTAVPGPNGEPQAFEISGSGPDPRRETGRREALTRQGWQPYSIRVGDRWYSYNRLDPIGFMLGFSADVRDLVRRRELAPEDVDEVSELVARAGAAISASVVSRTWMQGLANIIEAVDQAGDGSLERYITRTAGSFVPAAVAQVERTVQPAQSEPTSPYEAILARIPGLSDRVPLRRDLWGREVVNDSGLGPVASAVLPTQARQVAADPIDQEMQRLDVDVQPIPRRDWGGANVNLRDWPEVYDAYRRLAGNELQHPAWGLGLHDFLDAVVSGRHDLSEVYRQLTDGRDGGRAQFIRNAVQEYRQLARQAIEADPQFSAFAEFVRGRQEQRREQRIPIRLN